MKMKEYKIPNATAKRIPLYYRYLKKLEESHVERIKSKEFSRMIQIPSATIRRDFSHFGELGRSGYGYDVSYLIEVFGHVLNTQVEKPIALVGVGNLGKALARYNFRRNHNLNIVCAFDTNPRLWAKRFVILSYKTYLRCRNVKKEGVTTLVSTVPSKHTQDVVDLAIENGVTAILTFSPNRLRVPDNVKVQYIDLTTELQTLIYFDENFTSTKQFNFGE